jgi:flagellar motor switch protein FliN/FliY
MTEPDTEPTTEPTTEKMTNPADPARTPAGFVQSWADSFSQVMGQIAGSSVACSLHSETPPDLAAAGEDDVTVLITLAGSLRGEMSLRAPPAAVLRLAQIFMSEPVAAEASLTADHREALIELLRQVAGIVSTAVRGRWGQVQFGVEVGAPSWSAAESFWLQVPVEGSPGLVLAIGLSAALVAELRAEKAEAAPIASSPTAGTKADAASGEIPARDRTAAAGALDLLLDVQLGLTMRFGSRRLLLREVLELTPGAVIELDRRVQDPVDLLLDGRLVARGEVVVIDGSYGLRVTDISPMALHDPTAGVSRPEEKRPG